MSQPKLWLTRKWVVNFRKAQRPVLRGQVDVSPMLALDAASLAHDWLAHDRVVQAALRVHQVAPWSGTTKYLAAMRDLDRAIAGSGVRRQNAPERTKR